MDASEIRKANWGSRANWGDRCDGILIEIAAQLAELNANIRQCFQMDRANEPPIYAGKLQVDKLE